MNESIFSILDEILESKFKISNSGGKITIYEDKSPKCKSIEIQTNRKVFAMSLDVEEKVFNCFNSSVENITSKNDGILMFIKSNKLVVLLIELKSNNSKGYLKQLKAGRNFINYLLMQIDLFYSINVQKENVLFRGILFDTRVRKGTTQRVLHFEDRNGLICTTLGCNQRYKLQTISESIKIDYE